MLRESLRRPSIRPESQSKIQPPPPILCSVDASRFDSGAAEFFATGKKIIFIIMECVHLESSSVAVESMFSTMGILLNARRSSLAPHTSEMVLFIHDNYSLYFP